MRKKQPWLISIEGVIGVGKTSLARLIHQQLDAALLLEVFEENPFLARFYGDRSRYAFQTQMFFLLSRYRQHTQSVPELVRKGHIVSDYTFAKDKMFAQVNLDGDEWTMYEKIHSALAEHTRNPDLLVYLKADLDVLMARIAQRDRPYERSMDSSYIAELNDIYDEYMRNYTNGQLLIIDTNKLNVITSQDDLNYVLGRIREALGEGTYQRALPIDDDPGRYPVETDSMGVEFDLAELGRELVETVDDRTDLFFSFMQLTDQIGQLSQELAHLWMLESDLISSGEAKGIARSQALSKRNVQIQQRLVECTDSLLTLADRTGTDLDAAYRRIKNTSNQ
ncbi:MAG: deoxynucleoside kinase [Chloroflexota bacterium]